MPDPADPAMALANDAAQQQFLRMTSSNPFDYARAIVAALTEAGLLGWSPPDGQGAAGYDTDDQIRRYALEEQRLHTPALQDGNGYDRCEHCHYTRHPCDVHELATIILALLDRGRTDP